MILDSADISELQKNSTTCKKRPALGAIRNALQVLFSIDGFPEIHSEATVTYQHAAGGPQRHN